MAGKCSVPHEKFPFWNLCWTRSFQALSSAGEASPRNWRIIQPSNWLPSLITKPDYQPWLPTVTKSTKWFIYVYLCLCHNIPYISHIQMDCDDFCPGKWGLPTKISLPGAPSGSDARPQSALSWSATARSQWRRPDVVPDLFGSWVVTGAKNRYGAIENQKGLVEHRRHPWKSVGSSPWSWIECWCFWWKNWG